MVYSAQLSYAVNVHWNDVFTPQTCMSHYSGIYMHACM